MTDEIPPPTPPHLLPPTRTLADLDRCWRSIKGPWGFARPQLWCVVLGPEGEWTSIFMKIDDCPERPDPSMIRRLLDVLGAVVADHVVGGSLALMFARPGGDEHRDDDRRWAKALDAAGRRAPFDVWPVFLANDVGVRVASPDDLAA